MSIADQIYEKLSSAFSPQILEVLDESDKHKGHAGARPGGETHFRVLIVASAFTGLSRLARQRAIYDLLEAEMADRVHALAIKARTPEEHAAD